MKYITVLGLDPSLSNLGAFKAKLCINDEGEVVDLIPLELSLTKTEKTKNKRVRVNSDDVERCRLLHKGLNSILTKEVELVFVELPVGSQSARSMASYGACISLIASIDKQPVIQLRPEELKVAACNKKTASKKEMIDWAVSHYPDENWIKSRSGSIHGDNEHIADALAAIVAGVATHEFKTLLLALTK
jgi:hypothetical protein